MSKNLTKVSIHFEYTGYYILYLTKQDELLKNFKILKNIHQLTYSGCLSRSLVILHNFRYRNALKVVTYIMSKTIVIVP